MLIFPFRKKKPSRLKPTQLTVAPGDRFEVTDRLHVAISNAKPQVQLAAK
jgi:hypothetical protein